MMDFKLALFVAIALSVAAGGQSQELPDAPSVVKTNQGNVNKNAKPAGPDSYTARVGFLCGSGVSMNSSQLTPTGGCGAGMTLVPFPIFLEFGVMAPQANRSNYTGYFSADWSQPLYYVKKKNSELQGLIGYSRLFETGHALDYGLSYSFPMPGAKKDSTDSMRIELRDYYTFSNPNQHNIMLRIGWMKEETD